MTATAKPRGERPILFSAPMVRAILAGTKSQTRRIVTRANSLVDGCPASAKSWASLDFNDVFVDGGPSPAGNVGPYLKVARPDPDPGESTRHRVYPRYFVGDLLWVRETLVVTSEGIEYAADGADLASIHCATAEAIELWDRYASEEGPDLVPTKIPSIFMPRWASRITLEVTEIRVQRLQEVSATDAIEEGINPTPHRCGCEPCAMSSALCPATESSLIMEYRSIWDSINGHGAWDRNPYVWAVSFKVVKT